MTLFRTAHQKDYTIINNTICTDKRLSWKAKGIWLYAFHRPDDWVFYQKEIMSNATDGEESVRAGLKELVECGYLIRNKIKDEEGKFSYDWCFHEKPQEIKEILPHGGFPDLVKPDLANPVLLNTERKLSKDTTNSRSPEVVVFSDLQISEGLKKSILKKYSEDEISQAVKRVKAWTDRTSDEAAILTCLERKDSWNDETLETPDDNKKYAQSFLPFENECFKLEIMNRQVEVTFFNSQQEPYCLKYDEKGFKTKLSGEIKKLKEKYEIYKNN